MIIFQGVRHIFLYKSAIKNAESSFAVILAEGQSVTLGECRLGPHCPCTHWHVAVCSVLNEHL